MKFSTTAPRARTCRVIPLNQYRTLSPLQWRRARGLLSWHDFALEYRRQEGYW